MLFVKIHYGLGNQMFQYSLARSLSIKRKLDFRLDLNFFNTAGETKHPRVYQLDHFNIKKQEADRLVVEKFVNPGFFERRWRQLSNKVTPYYKRKVVHEVRLDFDENIFDVRDNSYLFGYWQDERYFSEISPIIKEELSFKYPADGKNFEMLQDIHKTNSVCIHIRRGDYLTDQFTVKNVGVCDLHYYKKAIDLIIAQVSNPLFFIFSDDFQWVKQEFSIDYPFVYVEQNTEETAYEDLRLMSQCKYHILANSSFSWWGAWCSNSMQVIAPKIWRVNGPDMYLPKEWLRI